MSRQRKRVSLITIISVAVLVAGLGLGQALAQPMKGPSAPSGAVGPGGPSLKLDKMTFKPGERIVVHFTASPAWRGKAWIGIIPSRVPHGSEATNDRYDIAYQYLKKRTAGSLVFRAPRRAGRYDFRMHDTDSNGREVAYVSFVVTGGPRIWLEKRVFAPGERIVVRFTANPNWPRNAWIGIIPSRVRHGSESVNDRHDVAYKYLRRLAGGVLVFRAPRRPGRWDFRMHDTDRNGREVAYVSFVVR